MEADIVDEIIKKASWPSHLYRQVVHGIAIFLEFFEMKQKFKKLLE